MRPQLVTRMGNRFVFNDKGVLPYMRKNIDLVMSAVSKVCTELKNSPDQYTGSNQEKLEKLNNRVYELLTEWKVYKG